MRELLLLIVMVVVVESFGHAKEIGCAFGHQGSCAAVEWQTIQAEARR